MRWLRILIPSWSFFEKPNQAWTLQYRVETEADWRPLTFPVVPAAGLNPRGNLNLAFQSIVNGLAQALDQPDLTTSPEYKLACSLVRSVAPAGRPFRFKLCADGEDVMLSGRVAP